MPLYDADGTKKTKTKSKNGTAFIVNYSCPENNETNQKRPSYGIVNKNRNIMLLE